MLVLALSACYTRQPLETSVPAPATRIIARVTDSGAVALGNAVGPGAQELVGVVASADATAWQVNLIRVDYRGGSSVLWNRELVSIPRFAFSNVSETRVNKPRSVLAAGLFVAGAFLASRLFTHGGSDDNPPVDPPPQNIRVPGGG